jgi:cob(I)alamin adenosyltransferase
MSDEDERNARHTEAMHALKAERDAMMQEKREGQGLLMVHTGDGKGKSTAAVGMIVRALGWGQRVGVVQYIKGKWITGERQFFRQFSDQVRWEVMGEGFTWDVADRQRDIAAARAAWAVSLEMIADPGLSLVVLDELNVALRYDYLDVAEVVAALQARPVDKHVCVTGRNAKPELLAVADLITEFTPARHPFEQGFKAQQRRLDGGDMVVKAADALSPPGLSRAYSVDAGWLGGEGGPLLDAKGRRHG